MIRSTPSSSGSGNITPASTTIVVSSQLSASMFMPNSPSPPSDTTSSIRLRNADLVGAVPGGTGSTKEPRLAAQSGSWERLKFQGRVVPVRTFRRAKLDVRLKADNIRRVNNLTAETITQLSRPSVVGQAHRSAGRIPRGPGFRGDAGGSVP